MSPKFLMLALLFAASSHAAQAAQPQLYPTIVRSVLEYPHYTIFDTVDLSIDGGVVTLTGKVTRPHKRDDLEKRVSRIDGVRAVRTEIEVLPVSMFDDDLRQRIARAIYGNGNFRNYAIMPNPPIHIIVEHGRVWLKGVVQSEVDRALARALAGQFGAFALTSELQTVAEVRGARELE